MDKQKIKRKCVGIEESECVVAEGVPELQCHIPAVELL